MCISLLLPPLTIGRQGEQANAPFNGMAPKSKLAFMDVMAGNGDLLIPDDMYNSYFLPAFSRTGARLFSSSWGAQEQIYSSTRYGCMCVYRHVLVHLLLDLYTCCVLH
jgi:hypothetical protein